MRPTGRLHIGHYFGALSNWIKLQSEYDCFYFVADWHALTTDYADTAQVNQNTLEIATDWLAAGLDPSKATLFVQSKVPEHAELNLLLSMVTPLGWLERVPTYKEQIENVKDKDLHTFGFLGYPVLQSADIVIYDANFVPVGEDQVPHVELTREIVRRFNCFYGFSEKPELIAPENKNALSGMLGGPEMHYNKLSTLTYPISAADQALLRSSIRRNMAEIGAENFLAKHRKHRKLFAIRDVLREPNHLLTETPRIPGTDGRKMSKSYGNFILLGEDEASIRTKTRAMVTDPARVRRQDPGNPDVCPVFTWHKLFSEQGTIDRVNRECRTAEIGCVDCKGLMADGLVRWIEPMRARRAEYEAEPQKVWDILEDGSKKARKVAKKTMRRVREAIFG
jgi:tryptophanyl-tRNA synthetase